MRSTFRRWQHFVCASKYDMVRRVMVRASHWQSDSGFVCIIGISNDSKIVSQCAPDTSAYTGIRWHETYSLTSNDFGNSVNETMAKKGVGGQPHISRGSVELVCSWANVTWRLAERRVVYSWYTIEFSCGAQESLNQVSASNGRRKFKTVG